MSNSDTELKDATIQEAYLYDLAVKKEWNVFIDSLHEHIDHLTAKAVEEVLDRIKTPTMADVWPNKPYDGSNTYQDMMDVVRYYDLLVNSERQKLQREEAGRIWEESRG